MTGTHEPEEPAVARPDLQHPPHALRKVLEEGRFTLHSVRDGVGPRKVCQRVLRRGPLLALVGHGQSWQRREGADKRFPGGFRNPGAHLAYREEVAGSERPLAGCRSICT